MSRAAKKRGLVWGAGLGLLAYVGLPYALAQFAGLGLIREGRKARRELALTFDDGPDPQTTPAVLNALAAAGARATFFVLAPRARAHPDLIARMLAEGHQVEPHAQRHVHAWLRTPWGAARDPVRAARDLAAITGQPATLHRPPHGAYTLGTLWGQRRAGVRGAHWSVEGRDWHVASTPQGVRERLGRLIYPGAVVVLHDAGPGARVTVPLLPDLLADLRSRGDGLVPLAELDGARPGDLAALRRRAFLLLDRLFDRAGHIRPVGGRADTLFRLGPVAFPLAGVRLADGTPVPKG
uniref:polysaccharide deacetylase family protein n=1 Tax=uncultured Deinococcus sp. TaxID=158789 RepID=UPI0037491229